MFLAPFVTCAVPVFAMACLLHSLRVASHQIITSHCPLVIVWCMSTGCKEVPSKVVQRLADCCPNISELCLRGVPKVTNETACVLINSLKHLRKLDLSGCVRIKEQVCWDLSLFDHDIVDVSLGYVPVH